MPGDERELRESALRRIVSLALDEDLDSAGDITSRAIFGPDAAGAARLVTREACVVSGLAAAAETCLQVDPDLVWIPLVHDGQPVPAAAEVARLEGRFISILAAERTLLNFLSRLSGISTLTAAYVEAVRGTAARIAATRKTSPGLRQLEKQAVVDGGGEAHRLGLYDAVLIKDNHIAAAGGVGAAIEAMSSSFGARKPGGPLPATFLAAVEVEVDTIPQLREALATAAGRILLDNMSAEQVRACRELVEEKTLPESRPVVEVSGGINIDSVRSYAEAGAEVISVGALTRSAPGIDISLEVTDERQR